MNKVYIYVVDRDFGFAPNPFHGYCTLATCKWRIRKSANVDDWIIGVGGSKLRATGRCIVAMRVTEKTTFNEYWENSRFLDKKPVRNGSSKMMVGDNIYHLDRSTGEWCQADSHHSNVDGSINHHNLKSDTAWSENVLVSHHFYYFGSSAPVIPIELIEAIEYKNGRNHRVFNGQGPVTEIIAWLDDHYRQSLNRVLGDPFNFDRSHKRYSGATRRVT